LKGRALLPERLILTIGFRLPSRGEILGKTDHAEKKAWVARMITTSGEMYAKHLNTKAAIKGRGI